MGAHRYIEINRERLAAGARCILLEASGFGARAAARPLIDKGDASPLAPSFWAAQEGNRLLVEHLPGARQPKFETH
jgi:hypothetical protein